MPISSVEIVEKLRKMCNVILICGAVVGVLLVTGSQLGSVLGQLSEMGDDHVTLKTLDAGSFVGQRIPEVLKMGADPNELPRSYFAFRGIPYARPPLGVELRWKGPQPPEVRRQARMAIGFKPMCSQWDSIRRKVVGSQDCLYLNVFTPYVPTTVRRPMAENMTSWTIENRNLLPVLVYVHGGEFISGSVNDLGAERFMKENVVVVTFNYRLGILGFLTNGQQALPGNYGLLDQIEALRWVQQNIYRFGGNPLRVSVFGNVEYLLLSQGAKGLFQSAIICPVSTTFLFTPSLGNGNRKEESPKVLLELFAKEAGCNLKNEDELIECLKVTEVDSLIRIQHRLMKFFSYPSLTGLRPVVDKDWESYPVLQDDPEVLLREGRYPSTAVPLMTGVGAYEGFNPFFEFYVKLGPERDDKLKDPLFIKERLKLTVKTILGVNANTDENELRRTFESVWDYYFGGIKGQDWDSESGRILWKLLRVFGDLTVNTGHRKFAQLLSSNSKAPVFNYIFNASVDSFSTYLDQRISALRGSSSNSNSSVKEHSWKSLHSSQIPPWHELYYLFDSDHSGNHLQISSDGSITTHATNQFNTKNFTPEDEALSDFLVKLWVSFANYGSPKQVIGKMGSGGRWVRATEAGLNYFVLGTRTYPLRGDFRKSECRFWTSILPQIRNLSEKIRELEPFPLLFWIFVGLTSTLLCISLILIIFICCNCRNSRDKQTYGEDTVVFINRIPTLRSL